MKLIVIGPRGKMGKLITQVAAEREDMELVAGVAPRGRDYIGTDLGQVAMVGRNLNVPVVDDLEPVIDSCDVIIDFSTKEMAMEVVDCAVRHKKALVCGTTGFSEEEKKKFQDAAAHIPMLYAANTSKLVNIMNKLLEIVTSSVGDEADIEILEMHDQWKKTLPAALQKKWGKLWRRLWEKNWTTLPYTDATALRQGKKAPLAITRCGPVISPAATPSISASWVSAWKSPTIPTTGNVLQGAPATALLIWQVRSRDFILSKMSESLGYSFKKYRKKNFFAVLLPGFFFLSTKNSTVSLNPK